MEDWIDKLKQDEDAKAERAHANASLWDALVSQVKAEVEKLRKTFPGDASKDVEYSVVHEGFSVVRNGFPYIRVEVLWGKKAPSAAVWVYTRPYAGADEQSNREEISFCWAAGDSVKMVFEGRSHMTAATLSEQIVRKVLDHG